MAHRIQVIVLELPLEREILEETLIEVNNAVSPLPVVIYDKDGELDESLIRPTMRFRHITRRLTSGELGDVVGAMLEEAAASSSEAASEREPWQDLLIGESRAMRELHAMIRLAGPRQSTVLITGETGTGKEMIARAHSHGQQAIDLRSGYGELRGDSGKPGGSGAFRTRQRRVHQRREPSSRPF